MALAFVCTTDQCSTLLAVVDTLSSILADVLLFVSNAGIKIGQLDGKSNSLVHLSLSSEGFKSFQAVGSHRVGVSFTSLLKILKTVKNANEITLLQHDTSYLEVRAVLPDRHVIHKVSTLDLEQNFVPFPDKAYEIKTEFTTAKLQDALRTMSPLTESVSIHVPPSHIPRKYLELRAKGSFTEESVIFKHGEFFQLHQRNHTDSCVGTFHVKTLVQAAKCVHLNKKVHVLLSHELPLILQYALTDAWSLTFAVAQLD